MFSEYHYMDKKINNANRFFIAWWRSQPVGCVAATGFPGCVRQGTAFREHRTVILPDFQGLGVGTRMSNAVASAMLRSGEALVITCCVLPCALAWRGQLLGGAWRASRRGARLLAACACACVTRVWRMARVGRLALLFPNGAPAIWDASAEE